MKYLAAFLLFSLLTSGAHAEFKAEYSLAIPEEYQVIPYTAEFQQWRDSLVKNLGYEGDQIETWVFTRTDITLMRDGKVINNAIYQSRHNPLIFFDDRAGLLIDFEKKLIGTMGTSGLSQHMSPSKRLWILICPTKGEYMYGVNLGNTAKTGSKAPLFSDPMKVAYQWK